MSKHVWDDINTDAKRDEETLGSSERQSFFFFPPQEPFCQSYLGQTNAVLKPISIF